MKIYLAGKITGDQDYKAKFEYFEGILEKLGHNVMNPAIMQPKEQFAHSDYMHICKAMIDVCDALFFIPDWNESKGARIERIYAEEVKKLIFDNLKEVEQWN